VANVVSVGVLTPAILPYVAGSSTAPARGAAAWLWSAGRLPAVPLLGPG
jgi:hypothetical protein